MPLLLAAGSPQLAWRAPIYILAGFAGIIGLLLLLVQPLLAAGWVPGLSATRSRCVHRWTGVALVAAVVIHVAGLWITSPPDVVDALLLVSPTPFSVWGVLAMWTIVLAATLAATRRRLRIRPRRWRQIHTALAALTGIGTVIHALQIQGKMETASKLGLCLLVLAVTARVVLQNPVCRTATPPRAKE